MRLRKLFPLLAPFLLSANECPPWLKNEAAPLCPKDHQGILDNTYPVRAHLISDASWPRDDSRPEAPYAPSKFIVDTFSATPDTPPYFFLSMSNDSIAKVKADLIVFLESTEGKKFADKKQLWMSMLIQSAAIDGFPWMQDLYEFSNNSQNGKTFFHVIGDQKLSLEVTNADAKFEELSRTLASHLSECGDFERKDIPPRFTNEERYVKEGEVVGKPNLRLSSSLGGNHESIAPGLSVMGNLSTLEYAQQFSAKEKKDILPISTSWLSVGHVDEIINTLPLGRKAQGQECPFALQVASVDKALLLLRNNPQGHFFSDNELAIGPRDPKVRDPGIKTEMCILVSRYKQAKPPIGDTPTHTSWLSSFLPNAYAGPGGLVLRDPCNPNDITNGEAYEALMYSAKDRINLNAIEKILKENQKVILKKIKETQNCVPVVIEAPYLFQSVFVASPETQLSDIRAQSFFPNPTNGVVNAKTYSFGAQPNKVFQDYLESEYRSIGITPKPLSTWGLHQLGGNLHCATQTVRFCRPEVK